MSSTRERNERLLREGVEAYFYLLEVRDGRAVRFHIYGDRQSAMNAVR